MKHQEQDEQKALFQWAKHYTVRDWMYDIHKGAYLAGDKQKRIRQMARLKSQGLKPGVYDICLPVARGGFHGLYIEMKAGKNKMTEKQTEFGDEVRKNGYATQTCYGSEEAIDVITRYLKLSH